MKLVQENYRSYHGSLGWVSPQESSQLRFHCSPLGHKSQLGQQAMAADTLDAVFFPIIWTIFSIYRS